MSNYIFGASVNHRNDEFICLCCGRPFPWSKAHEAKTVNRGPKRYVCDYCFEVKRYSTKNVESTHGTKKHGMRFGFELECVPYSDADRAALCSSLYGFIPTSDSSLPYGGIEFKTPVYNSFNGVKQMLRTVEKFADLTPHECGTHINVSRDDMTIADMGNIRDHGHEIFDPLVKILESDQESCERVFGRCLNTYAGNESNYCSHYSWISLRNPDRIEFRLCKFKDASQYFWLANMVSEITATVIDWSRKGRYEIAAGKIIKIFQKYRDGRALCQRPERNSK